MHTILQHMCKHAPVNAHVVLMYNDTCGSIDDVSCFGVDMYIC